MVLPLIRKGSKTPALVMLHYFGGSSREWSEVTAILSPQYECIALDLPGFGDAASVPGHTVESMTDQIKQAVDSLGLPGIVLVGHSMSGKLALVLAARKLAKLCGLVLLTSSPPSPEPIPEPDRKKMLALRRKRADAEIFLDGITAQPLVGDARERAVQDFVRCSPIAWSAWLEYGSKEDWSARVGIVDCQTLVITGEADPSLPAAIQKQSTLPHLSQAHLEIIPECGHLPPLEYPAKLAELISKFVHDL